MTHAPTRAPRVALAALAATALVASACTSEEPEAAPTPEVIETPESVVVGSADFNESKLIAEVYALVLEDKGVDVDREFAIGFREEYLPDLDAGTVDIVPEYIGTLAEDLNRRANGLEAEPVATGNTEETAEALRELLEPYDGVIAEPAKAESTAAFAVTSKFAKKEDVKKLSDLKALNKTLVGGGPEVCAGAPFCQGGLEDVYKIKFKELKKLDTGGPKTLNALSRGTIDVGLVLSTDPAVDERNLVVLKDDKNLQVAGNVTALMRGDVASDELVASLSAANAALTTKELRALNDRVSVKGFPVDWAAAKWAASNGLIAADAVPKKPKPTPPPTFTPEPKPKPKPEPDPEPAAEPAPEPAPAPSASYPRNQGEPSAAAVSQNWPGLAQCESGGNPSIISSNGLYHGLYQFSIPTWQAMGGSGAASSAVPDEQTYRAQILWDRAGPGQWPVCGANL